MDQPIVSICIPTFNRAQQLKKTLESIVVQDEFKNNLVEVVISDNASIDNTQELCKEYSLKYSNVKYFKNTENVRDANFPLAISRASGILRKLHNDTLLLQPNALRKLCDLTEKHKETKPCIFLSNGSCNNVAEGSLNFRDFAVSVGFHVTWIASFTIWGDECANIENDLAGCDLRLWQVRKFYENAFKKDTVIVSNYLFGIGQIVPQKDISYGLYTVFYENYMLLLSPYISNNALNVLDVETIERDLLYNFFTSWIIQWEINRRFYHYSESENLKECVFKQYKEKTYWPDYQRYYTKKVFRAKIKRMIKVLLRRN